MTDSDIDRPGRAAGARFDPLPTGAIRPSGWLRRQCELQAANITGRLPDLWSDVGPESGWLGGDGEDWERGPYFLDGLVPLAHVLADRELLGRAEPWIEAIIGSQRADGMFGPSGNDDWWPRMVALKVLIQHAEATGDERVLPLCLRYFRHQLDGLPRRPLTGWGRARGADNALSVWWAYRRTGESSLLELIDLLRAQTLDWATALGPDLITGKATDFAHATHGPNVAMGLKAEAVWQLVDPDPAHRALTARSLAAVERWHGQAHGWFSGDEWLAGRDPNSGVETCQVVELMYSLETLQRVFGDASFGDDLEHVAFNLLAASSDPEMRAHQYLQQPNQVASSVDRRSWSFSTDDANLFGLEPHFGCCTANLHQGWPKFVGSLWLRDGDDGLVAAAYAPCRLSTTLAGVAVELDVRTDYPFDELITITVTADRPVLGRIVLRLPEWCADPEITLGGEPVDPPVADDYATLDREWTTGDVITLRVPMDPVISRRERQAATVRLGPLQMVLSPGENWIPVPDAPGLGEWEIRPRTNWNLGLVLDGPRGRDSWTVARGPVGEHPFALADPPTTVRVTAGQVTGWQLAGADPGPLPDSPTHDWVVTEAADLVPYGCARLRITELPVLAPH